jgi:hypothetical protein
LTDAFMHGPGADFKRQFQATGNFAADTEDDTGLAGEAGASWTPTMRVRVPATACPDAPQSGVAA